MFLCYEQYGLQNNGRQFQIPKEGSFTNIELNFTACWFYLMSVVLIQYAIVPKLQAVTPSTEGNLKFQDQGAQVAVGLEESSSQRI